MVTVEAIGMDETEQSTVYVESKVLSTELKINQAFSLNLLNHIVLILFILFFNICIYLFGCTAS